MLINESELIFVTESKLAIVLGLATESELALRQGILICTQVTLKKPWALRLDSRYFDLKTSLLGNGRREFEIVILRQREHF